MFMPGLTLTGVQLHAPNANVFVFEQNLVADGPKL